EPGEGATHRDPRLRELRAESPAGARRPQSEIGREGPRPGEIRSALQGGQGTAREGRSEIGYWAGGMRTAASTRCRRSFFGVRGWRAVEKWRCHSEERSDEESAFVRS